MEFQSNYSYFIESLSKDNVFFKQLLSMDCASKKPPLLLLNRKLYPNILFRLSYYFFNSSFPFLSYIPYLLNELIYGVTISPRTKISGGFFLPHPHGVIIGAKFIGENVIIFQNVTIGASKLDLSSDFSRRPVIENNVTIYPCAGIYGHLTIRSNSVVPSNHVVTKDFPPLS